MKHSILIARLMGPALLLMGIGMVLGLWLSPDTYAGVMKDFMGNLALIWLMGILALVAGLAIVNAHNVWIGDWRVLITILGWLLIVRGVTNLLLPGKVQALGNRMMEGHGPSAIGAVALLVLGGILTAMGYEEMWEEHRPRPAPARASAPARTAKPARKTKRRRR
jgi:hypothetical protein